MGLRSGRPILAGDNHTSHHGYNKGYEEKGSHDQIWFIQKRKKPTIQKTKAKPPPSPFRRPSLAEGGEGERPETKAEERAQESPIACLYRRSTGESPKPCLYHMDYLFRGVDQYELYSAL